MDKTKRNEALLAILLGSFGAHYFYRGKIGLGILRIVLGWGGILVLATPLLTILTEPMSSDLGFAILFSVILMHIGPLIMIAPIVSVIVGIVEGGIILHEVNLSSKKKYTNESTRDDNSTQLGQKTATGPTKLQDVYPTPKENQSSNQDINSESKYS